MGFGSPQGAGVNPLKQYDLASDPASVVNLGQAYWKDTGSGNEFFLEDETGNVTQVTEAGRAGLYNVFPASLYVTGGKIGLGTQTPSSTFEIEGSSGDLILEIDNNAVNSANFQIQNGAGNARADLVLDSNTHITMKGQRVGILNSDPSYTLDVLGDGRFVGNSFEIENSSGDLVFEMDNNAATSSNFQIQNGAGNARADFVLDSQTHITMKSQRVGIVQTNPSYTLDVTGNAQVTTDMTVGGSVGLGVTDPDEQLEITGRLHMGQIAAPGTTTDKLYNVAGALTWNGTDLTASGGISSIRTETGATYTAATTDDLILCNAAAITVTLFAASGNSGEVLYLKNIHATGVVTISGDAAGETLDGDVSKFITTQYATLTLVCDGSDWHII